MMIRSFLRPVRSLGLKQVRCFSYKFASSHEYVRLSDSAVGITHHAQELLGEIVYIDLPDVGSSFEAGETFAAVESVKAASDVYMPVSGEIVEVNTSLADEPGTINEAAETDGWFVKIKLAKSEQLDGLMNKEQYDAKVEEGDEDH